MHDISTIRALYRAGWISEDTCIALSRHGIVRPADLSEWSARSLFYLPEMVPPVIQEILGLTERYGVSFRRVGTGS